MKRYSDLLKARAIAKGTDKAFYSAALFENKQKSGPDYIGRWVRQR